MMGEVKHTPGPMRPSTAIEFSANAAHRWRAQYRNWSPFNKFSDGTTKGDVDDALDREAHTPESIARILNDGWAYPECRSCQKRWPVVVEMSAAWSDDTWALCLRCAERAVSILEQFPDARAAVTKAEGQS